MNWQAQWIAPHHEPSLDVGIFLFEQIVSLVETPEHLLVRVSADQRYKLWVNGEMVAFGPQRGDLEHWFYDWFDLGPYLREGENTFQAYVWNFGWLAPMAQFSRRTAFLFEVVAPEGVTLPDEILALRTPGNWQVATIPNWSFGSFATHEHHVCPFVGPGESYSPPVNLHFHGAVNVIEAAPRGAIFEPHWMLIPRSLPAMRYSQRAARPIIRHSSPDRSIFLFDFQELLNAYPRFTLVGQPGTVVTVTYAESMWTPEGTKGNRDDVDGKQIRGYQDRITLGDARLTFEPLWWRTWRYIQIESNAPLDAVEIDTYETGYPLAIDSSFSASDHRVKPLWDVSVRTAERCAAETYFDCPYYEQLQYVGDTRIQALIGYYLSTDRRLQRNAIDQFGWSISDLGITQSRYPNRLAQVIPPFSLWWILMRQDQRLYDRLPNLDEEIDAKGLDVANAFNALSGEPLDRTFWNFGDWVAKWQHGIPPGGIRSTMHMLTLYLAHAATELALDGPGSESRANQVFTFIADQIERVDGLVKHRRDPDWEPSEHNEALWRLIQQRLGFPMDPWPTAALQRKQAAKCTYYFSYYKHLAMRPSEYLAELQPWTQMIEDGLTTFAENPGPTRSDCHAWSAHPILGFFQIVAGVTSSSPGWRSVRIAPNPGPLSRFDAKVSHFDGEIRVSWEDERFKIESPVPVTFEWGGRTQSFEAGRFEV